MSTYLCGIARNLLKKEWQRRARQNHQPLETAETVPASNCTEAEVISTLSRNEIYRRIHQLPEAMREVMYLRLSGELSFAEIGGILNKTENWARVTFYRAKQKLKEGGEE